VFRSFFSSVHLHLFILVGRYLETITQLKTCCIYKILVLPYELTYLNPGICTSRRVATVMA
jgi:hypothetical protein